MTSRARFGGLTGAEVRSLVATMDARERDARAGKRSIRVARDGDGHGAVGDDVDVDASIDPALRRFVGLDSGGVCAAGVFMAGAIFALMFGWVGLAIDSQWREGAPEDRPLLLYVGQTIGAVLGVYSTSMAHRDGVFDTALFVAHIVGAVLGAAFIRAMLPHDIDFEHGLTAVFVSSCAKILGDTSPFLVARFGGGPSADGSSGGGGGGDAGTGDCVECDANGTCRLVPNGGAAPGGGDGIDDRQPLPV